jgi:hypothetical protein
MLKEFRATSTWESSFPWGSGHTAETDPSRRGWRLRGVSSYVAVIGRTGVRGCFTVVPLSGGYDVATHDEIKPEEAFKRLKAGERLVGDAYRQVGTHSGWALELIREFE